MRLDCFPGAPPEWDRVVVDAFAKVAPRYRLDKSKEYPFVEMAAVAEQFGGITSWEWRKPDASGLARFKQNDILFGKITPCAENGKVALVQDWPADFGLGSTEFIVLSPREHVDPRWAYAVLCANPVLGRAISRMEGSTGRLRVTEDTFTKWLYVPRPRPSEQTAIARILDAADTAIERTRTALAQAQSLKTSLVQNLFSRGLRSEPLRQTEVGRAPRSWTVAPVGDLLTEAQYGLSMPMNAAGAYPILRMAAIQDGDVLLNDLKYVDLHDAIAKQYMLARGDVLFNRTNSQELVGKVGVYRHDAPAVFASYLIRLKVNADLADNYFLGQLLASYGVQCRIKRFATPGVQQVNINATNLQRVRVALPIGPDGIKEQREIAGILERQDESIRRLESQVDLAQRLKRGLMQALLTGRVRTCATANTTESGSDNLWNNGALSGSAAHAARPASGVVA